MAIPALRGVRISPHFLAGEFACRHCGAVGVSPALLEGLELLRSIVGARPLVIVSGFRCPDHNRAVGGARDSRHMYADAADLNRGYATVDQAERAGFRGIGRSGPWATHVDMRPTPARWVY